MAAPISTLIAIVTSAMKVIDRQATNVHRLRFIVPMPPKRVVSLINPANCSRSQATAANTVGMTPIAQLLLFNLELIITKIYR